MIKNTLLDYLRQGFESLEDIPKGEIDDLIDEIKLYRLSENKSKEKLEQLVALVAYYHAGISKKLALAESVELKLTRKQQAIRSSFHNLSTKPTKTAKDFDLQSDPTFMEISEQLDLCTALKSFLTSMQKVLYMDFYALRNENQNRAS